MGTRRYLNFDLLLEQQGAGQYEARVTSAPVAGLPHVRFQLPFDEKSLKILLMELDPGRTDVRGADGATQQRAAREFGGPLFESIFSGKLADAWEDSLRKVAAEKAGGLRLRIRVADDAGDLAGLPWELLYDASGRAFPAQSEITPLVRFLDVAAEVEPIQVTGPLRVLAIISSPAGLRPLEVEREWALIQAALAAKVREGLVVVDRLPAPTVDALGEWLLEHDTHVIHFVGHGDFDASGGEGWIFFQNEDGGPDPVSAAVLGPFVHDHDALRMVVINACRAARVGPTDPYGGMAQGLVMQGAMAVIAMQFPITDPAAVMFTGKFYGALAAGLPVDQSVSYARKALHAKFRSEWATPVLFMRSPDGDIFQDLHAPEGWVVQEPPTPEEVTPSLDGIREPDLDVTDITLPQVDPPPPDQYEWVFGPTPSKPDPPKLDPPKPDRLEEERLEEERRRRLRRRLAMGGAAALLVALAVVVALSFRDPTPVQADQTEFLSDSQMLVAAGASFESLDIYLIDTADPDIQKQLTHDGHSWLPVLSPDRRSMIYVRRLDPDDPTVGQLRMASATDGSGDLPVDLPAPCSTNVSRPAWIPGTEDLVLRCTKGDEVALVRVGVDGSGLDVLLDVGVDEASGLLGLGDPAVSGDGDTVVFFGRTAQSGERGTGNLYRFDLSSKTLTPEPLLEESEDGFFAYTDAVFSQQEGEEWLAWRAANTVGGETNYEVYAARFVDGRLGSIVTISNPTPGRKEQDPMFSPDGTKIVYGSQKLPSGPQQLWVASVADPSDRQWISANDPPFWAVPAWSGR